MWRGKEAGKLSRSSCGQVGALPQLIESADCFNPFQPEVMDPYEMKRLYAGKLSFWGGEHPAATPSAPDEVAPSAGSFLR